MTANKITNEGIVTQLAVVHTMLPKVKELIDQQAQEIEQLKEFAVWMSGCGYDFTQHDYFIRCRDSLLKKASEK